MQREEFEEDIRHLKRFSETARGSPITSLTPFLDEEGALRVGGRLEAASLSYEAKHPLLLPYSHPFTKMIMVMYHKENLHCGPQALLASMKQKFCPIKGKTIARSVVQQCIRCTRAKPKLLTQMMGNLPSHRVQPTRPFLNAGVDFCGPIKTHFKVRGKHPQKTYIAVFCCFSTKAVDLELVTDLSTNDFIAAMKRFIGRRGSCQHLYCDNATNFVGANNQLQEMIEHIHTQPSEEKIQNTFSARGIEFHFIPPRAPHFGGLWEAAVKSAKHLLYRCLGGTSLTYEGLETTIIEIDAVMNSRPITAMSDNPNDLMALTPGHFIIGEPLTNPIDPVANTLEVNPSKQFKVISNIQKVFWKRWHVEYLNELQQRHKWQRKHENLRPGTLVIIKEDNCPVMKWPLGSHANLSWGRWRGKSS
ncbi:uncharacterized protein LOC129906873 [Episyrphus balteatus]|uniref:uncharacterized protein LOC129906873 n=1 Tax=Episyrphus balteatus TaxID=286459 RepID=UPI0024854C0A|nr:uncharacterized protein LOC129906873 [Episyrphus balteatus]